MTRPLEKVQTAVAFDFVPVIFANGKDDDLRGLIAAFRNERVQYEDRIYEVDEPVIIRKKTMFFSAGIYLVGHNNPVPDDIDLSAYVVVVQPEKTRYTEVTNCQLIFPNAVLMSPIWMNS